MVLGFSLAVSDNYGLVSVTLAIVYVLIQDYGYNNIPSLQTMQIYSFQQSSGTATTTAAMSRTIASRAAAATTVTTTMIQLESINLDDEIKD